MRRLVGHLRLDRRENRVQTDAFGVSEPEIRKQSGREIVIQLAGIHDPEQAAKLIGKTAQLQFYDLEADIAPPTVTAAGQPAPKASLYPVLAPVQSQVTDKANQWYLFKNKRKVAGPATSKKELLASPDVKALLGGKSKLPKRFKVFGVPWTASSSRAARRRSTARASARRRGRATTSSSSTRTARTRSPR